MKIIQIGSFPQDSQNIKGGVEASIYGLAQIQAEKHKVFILDFPRYEIKYDKVENHNNLDIYRFRLPFRNNISALLRIKDYFKLIKQLNPDVCHLHGSSPFVLFLYKFLKYRHIKCVLTIHGLVHIEKKKQLKTRFKAKLYIQYLFQSWAEFKLLNLADHVIVDTDYVKRAIENYFRSNKISHLPELHVVPQGINEAYYHIIHDDKKPELILLAVGAFVERKGHHKLIEAFVKLTKEHEQVKLKIAGALTNQEYYKNLNNMINHYDLYKKVELISNIGFKKLLQLYADASIFVLYTAEESQGIVFGEAMASGLPIVSTKVGGVPDVVKDGVNGYLIEYEKMHHFVLSIKQLILDPNKSKEITENNLKDSERYSWNSIEIVIEKIYSKL